MTHEKDNQSEIVEKELESQQQRPRSTDTRQPQSSGVGLIIGNQLANPDPVKLMFCLFLTE